MPANVIRIDDFRPHLSGEVKCLHCGSRWVGVCPISMDGTLPTLECPECGLMQGFYIYPVLPGTGDETYRCNCGGDIFTAYRAGLKCAKCGHLHDPEEVFG